VEWVNLLRCELLCALGKRLGGSTGSGNKRREEFGGAVAMASGGATVSARGGRRPYIGGTVRQEVVHASIKSRYGHDMGTMWLVGLWRRAATTA
jgi:hypothetical protein